MGSSVPFQIVPGFAIPFAHTEFPDSSAINQELSALFFEKANDGALYSNNEPSMVIGRNLFESRFDLFRWDYECVSKLREFCYSALYKTVAELNGYGNDEITNLALTAHSWFHISKPGASFGLHNHPMASWSGIYCVDSGYPPDVEPGSGEVLFMHPAATSGMFTDLGVANIRKPWAIAPRQYRLRPGQLVLFPSWLLHQVAPYEGGGARVTVAFNAWFRDKSAHSSQRLD